MQREKTNGTFLIIITESTAASYESSNVTAPEEACDRDGSNSRFLPPRTEVHTFDNCMLQSEGETRTSKEIAHNSQNTQMSMNESRGLQGMEDDVSPDISSMLNKVADLQAALAETRNQVQK